MPRLSEQELNCPICGKTKQIPFCCGRNMEKDEVLFFCPICDREISTPRCCDKDMEVRTKVLDIKKEIFRS